MGTKANPDQYDCYTAAEPDEPIFTLRAKDKDAPHIVRIWALLREMAVEAGIKPPSDMAQVNQARQLAYEMDRWRHARILISNEEYMAMDVYVRQQGHE